MKSLTACQNDANSSGRGTSPSLILEPGPKSLLQQGNLVIVYWIDDGTHYSGTVSTLHSEACPTVHYDEEDVERLNMDEEV